MGASTISILGSGNLAATDSGTKIRKPLAVNANSGKLVQLVPPRLPPLI